MGGATPPPVRCKRCWAGTRLPRTRTPALDAPALCLRASSANADRTRPASAAAGKAARHGRTPDTRFPPRPPVNPLARPTCGQDPHARPASPPLEPAKRPGAETHTPETHPGGQTAPARGNACRPVTSERGKRQGPAAGGDGRQSAPAHAPAAPKQGRRANPRAGKTRAKRTTISRCEKNQMADCPTMDYTANCRIIDYGRIHAV